MPPVSPVVDPRSVIRGTMPILVFQTEKKGTLVANQGRAWWTRAGMFALGFACKQKYSVRRISQSIPSDRIPVSLRRCRPVKNTAKVEVRCITRAGQSAGCNSQRVLAGCFPAPNKLSRTASQKDDASRVLFSSSLSRGCEALSIGK